MTALERPPSGRSAEQVLAEWRRAERARDELANGTDDWLQADQLVRDLRDEYQSAVQARVARLLADELDA